jgi:4-hydroxy-4-methyl-2-oxoglutarate aldolase
VLGKNECCRIIGRRLSHVIYEEVTMNVSEQNIYQHKYQGTINTSINRPSKSDIEIISSSYTAFVLDRMGKHGAVHSTIKPLYSGMICCGPAVTSLGPDLSVRRMTIDVAEPGDVLVVAAGGCADYACFGDGTAKRMSLKMMSGAVIDGAVRDAGGLKKLGFPTFCKGVTPRNYHYPVSAEYGAVNVPVNCGGVSVSPGDLIFGDEDGVIVIPKEMVSNVAKLVSREIVKERDMRSAMTSYVQFDVKAELLKRGYKFNDSK